MFWNAIVCELAWFEVCNNWPKSTFVDEAECFILYLKKASELFVWMNPSSAPLSFWRMWQTSRESASYLHLQGKATKPKKQKNKRAQSFFKKKIVVCMKLPPSCQITSWWMHLEWKKPKGQNSPEETTNNKFITSFIYLASGAQHRKELPTSRKHVAWALNLKTATRER